MIPEIGHFALILGLILAMLQGFVPMVGAWRNERRLMAMADTAAYGHALFLTVSYLCLTYAFVHSDFSVAYVAKNSNAELPLFYRISAVWGSHEGSVLLWSLVLALWTLAVCAGSRTLPPQFRARVLGVMGLLSVGFLAFILLTSNPFVRWLPAPAQGADLNPLLQDPGMVIHPPLLYIGYVGLAVPFAFAVAALLGGRMDAAWTRWTRPWTTLSWVFLTAGITLGSWWAYSELGWGGWWFWDPVENASFMPWLVATALIHSLAVTEQRSAFKAWTLLLSIAGFSLSLLGTFLVRSGVLVSVHAFATDPARGSFILAFLALVVGGALALYAWRAPALAGGGQFEFFSRETLLLVNNVLLVVACGSIMLGTLYPLVLDAFGVGKISVGPPYFNAVFIPLMLPLVFLIGVGPATKWKRERILELRHRLAPAFLLAVAASVVIALLLPRSVIVVGAGLTLALWVVLSTAMTIFHRVRHRRAKWAALMSLPRGFWGMSLAHVGVAVFVIGVLIVSVYNEERDVRMAPGDTTELAGYQFQLVGVRNGAGPNYRTERAEVVISRDGQEVTRLYPEKRYYRVQAQPMTEAAVDASLWRDLYVALGEPLPGPEQPGAAWSVRVHWKPFVRWVWLGPLIMALGGLICVTDRRYRASLRQPEPVPAGASVATS